MPVSAIRSSSSSLSFTCSAEIVTLRLWESSNRLVVDLLTFRIESSQRCLRSELEQSLLSARLRKTLIRIKPHYYQEVKKNTGRCFRKVSMSFLWIHDSLIEYWQEVVHVRYRGHEQKKTFHPPTLCTLDNEKFCTLNNSYHSWRCCFGGCFFAPRRCSHGGKFACICDQVVEEIQKLMTVSQPKHRSWDVCCPKKPSKSSWNKNIP